ncbi:hypothetical protein LHYA1_G005371 [Lachnellula hyalina]|uniref:Uncharacterized protein n=1 Tax=Lachnellula hyalina TaxID=1316788 RepID=A0A8H8R3D0_9HELO|nr:uncharacterized protein LHYA1_G005371 [Lachnellula hyalina]TVY26149.1 hypothetical protein LHYA1_G005371 [Lachnellula hyalina]
MSQNQSIRNFFKPAQSNVRVAVPPVDPARQSSLIAMRTQSTPSDSKPQTSYTNSNASKSSEQGGLMSSLSPPSSVTESPPEVAVLSAPSSNEVSGRVVKSSDDEESDSDDSFPELFRSTNGPPPAKRVTPSTPSKPRSRRVLQPLMSPIPVHPKYSLESIVKDAENDKADQETSKRVKAMLDTQINENTSPFASGLSGNQAKFDGALLESVVANTEDGGMEKVTRALQRTEATNVEKFWYFFGRQDQAAEPPRPSFPTSTVPKTWQRELSKPAMRDQTFISGFAEDMVHFGQALPDEIFLWVLDEACLEPSDVLRTSYLNTLKESREQVERLLSPDLVDKMLRDLGGTPIATTITGKMKPSPKITARYSRDWAHVRSALMFFTGIADSLQRKTREHMLCMLLRMGADHVVFKNVDVLDVLQQAIRRLCKYIPDDEWGHSCQRICEGLIECIDQPSLRLQVVDSIPSFHPRTHELRRRLGMCFLFDDVAYSIDHPHTTFELQKFMDRLKDPVFKVNDKTDYQQLAALISLLDVAVDDGRCAYLDLANSSAAERFDEDVDKLVLTINKVIDRIGSPGAAFISRIEAKELLLLVSQRIADTLRSKPKPKKSLFDGSKKKEDHVAAQAGMSNFLSLYKKGTKPVNGHESK